MSRLLFLILTILLLACQEPKTWSTNAADTVKEDQVLFEMATTYLFPLPENAGDDEGPASSALVALGKALYLEKNLSLDRTVSCNTCHPLADYGVTHTAFSQGVNNKTGARNAPSIYNAALHLAQFWDGRSKDVESQIEGPLFNPNEMGMPSKSVVVDRIVAIPKYDKLFAQAYDSEWISYKRIARAIGAFEKSLLTPSRLDTYLKGDLTALSSQEKTGLRTMLDKGCIPCHSGAAMGGALYQKFGIFDDYRNYTKSPKGDNGRMAQSHVEMDRDVFKVPSLRNVTMTAPYFHDGSVDNLEEAIQIMSKLQLGQEMSEAEITSIIAFLAVTTDWL